MSLLRKIEAEAATILSRAGILRDVSLEGTFEVPPRPELGDLATKVCFTLASKLRKSPAEIAAQACSEAEVAEGGLIERVEAKGGYINFYFNWPRVAEELLKEALKPGYGKPVVKPMRVMVEHTSVNPNKALHIGHARNACLGDFVSRLLRFAGHEVIVANYIDDTGTQVADIVVGFLHLGFPLEKEGVKFDQYCGDDVYVRVNRMYSEKPELLEKRREVMKLIDEGGNDVADFARKLAERVLRSQLQTLWRLGVYYDLLNWESDILRAKLWEQAFRKLKAGGYVYYAEDGKAKGCWLLKLSHLPEFSKLESPDEILVRSDGTVLYPGKDIAYAMWKHGLLEDTFSYKIFSRQPNGKLLWTTTVGEGDREHPKFNDVELSINVIDVRQSYEQKVVAAALQMLSRGEKKYIHYAYEVVSLSRRTARKMGIEADESRQFIHMSGRRGWYVNADTLLEALYQKALEETRKRNPDASREFLEKTAEAIAVSAFRYEMLKVSPDKMIVFDLDEALKLEGNTAPYLQYAHTRCAGILRKAGDWSPEYKPRSLKEPEKALLRHILMYPKAVESALRDLRPIHICSYAHKLATLLNEFYQKCPVIKAEEHTRSFRLTLVKAAKCTLASALDLLGIVPLERM